MNDVQALVRVVQAAAKERQALAIRGGGSKDFYGRAMAGEVLDVTGQQGVVAYHPEELVLTVGAGTPLMTIQQLLGEHQQQLGFEPPMFGDTATIGGSIATALAGPARPYMGSVADFVLGVKCLSGRGEILRFGGQVMKNVAGFDVARLMVGSLGCLGILLEVSLKVLPCPPVQATVCCDEPATDSLARMNALAGQPIPLSAAAWVADKTYLRFSGVSAAVEAAIAAIAGEVVPNGAAFWQSLSEQQHAFFRPHAPLLRGTVAPATAMFASQLPQLLDWGGARRWYCGEQPLEFSAAVQRAGGYVTQFRNGARDGEVFASLTPPLLQLHRTLKHQFDPMGIFNPGRMYRAL